MKRIVLSLAIVAGLAFSATSCKKSVAASDAETVAETSAGAVTYTVDTNNSIIEWKGSKIIGGGFHTGTITLKSGEISVKEGVIEAGSFVIDMNTITVTDIDEEDKKGKLEAHLKGATEENANHFFNVAQYPEGKFEITSVADGAIHGNLTLKGVSKNVSFTANISVTENYITITADPFNIDRTQWGINYNNESMADLAKDRIISNSIEIKFTVKAIK